MSYGHSGCKERGGRYICSCATLLEVYIATMPMRTPWLLLFFAPFARGLAKDPQIAHIPPLNTCEPVNITWEYGTPPFDMYVPPTPS